MADKARTRLSPDAPIVREHEIISTEQFRNDKSITICSYVKGRKTGNKTADGKDIWEDVVMKEWVHNPENYDLKGLKIRTEISIVK